MGLTASMIDALLAAGGTAEQLAALVKADLAEQEVRKASKRENNAERQRRFKSRRRGYRAGNAGNALSDVTPPIEDIIPPVSSNDETAGKPAKPKRVEAIACPEGVRPTVWADFKRLRAKKGGGVSLTALEGIAAEAKKAGWTLDAALAEAVTRNWQGFKAEWVAAAPVANDPGDSLVAKILARQARGP